MYLHYLISLTFELSVYVYEYWITIGVNSRAIRLVILNESTVEVCLGFLLYWIKLYAEVDGPLSLFIKFIIVIQALIIVANLYSSIYNSN